MENVLNVQERGSNDFFHSIHYPLHRLTGWDFVIAKLGNDTAGQAMLNGSPVECTEDWRPEACPFKLPQKVQTLLYFFGQRGVVEGPGEIIYQVKTKKLVHLTISNAESSMDSGQP